MYLLYRKLGISAIIGASCCIAFMTPLQFWIGKKMSDNSKLTSVSKAVLINFVQIINNILLVKMKFLG